MLRPRIQAPRFAKPRAAKSSSTPSRGALSPISDPAKSPAIFWKVFVPKTQLCSAMPPMPIGLSRSWPGPAPYPSMEIENALTRSLDMRVTLSQADLRRDRLERVDQECDVLEQRTPHGLLAAVDVAAVHR